LLHPTPALSGFPHQVAKTLIAGLEPFDRELFGGIVGWCDAEGNGEWVVTIAARAHSRKPRSVICRCGHCPRVVTGGGVARNRRQVVHHAERFWPALRSDDDHSLYPGRMNSPRATVKKVTGWMCR
jgi:isochorismate synthase